MNDLCIFPGDSNIFLAEDMCRYLCIPTGAIEHQQFPNGERWSQFEENIRGKDVFLVQSMTAPVNDNFMQLLIMADAAKRASAGRLTAVVPYFGYARQDRKDKPRVPITAKLIMNLLEAAGFNRILTMDLHAPQIGGFTDLPLDQLSFKPALITAVKNLGIECIVSPDIGAIKRANDLSKAMQLDLAIITKKRNNATSVTVENFIGNIKNKNVLIVDDLTESCGTIVEAAKACRENGAQKVYGAITHGCFTQVGQERLTYAFENDIIDHVFISNTTSVHVSNVNDYFITVVDVAPLFASAIKCIHNNESISSLFT